jgi:hypothetical protein
LYFLLCPVIRGVLLFRRIILRRNKTMNADRITPEQEMVR